MLAVDFQKRAEVKSEKAPKEVRRAKLSRVLQVCSGIL